MSAQGKLEEPNWNKNLESLDGLAAKLFRLEKRLDDRVLADFIKEIASIRGNKQERDEQGRDFARAVNIVEYVGNVKGAARTKLSNALSTMQKSLADLEKAKTWTDVIAKAKKYQLLKPVSITSGNTTRNLEKRINEIITNFNDLFKSLRALSIKF